VAKKIDYYALGKQFANRPVDEYQFDDAPAMSYEERVEFNAGFDDASKENRLIPNLFVAGLVIVVVFALFSLVGTK